MTARVDLAVAYAGCLRLKRELFLPFITLLEDHLDVLTLDASRDWRGEGLEGERVYFQPLSIETSAEFDGFWRRLVGDRVKPLQIQVLGREFVMTAYENGIARERFTNLCEQHLGPANFFWLWQEPFDSFSWTTFPCLARHGSTRRAGL